MHIGVISDTHGVLPQRALELLQGVEQIIHAGDIGGPEIMTRLEAVAPVQAVAGNMDGGGPLARLLPEVLSLVINDCRIYVRHEGWKPAQWSRRLPEPRPDVAICGHSHQSLLEEYEGVLYLNPGTAGRPRFGHGLSLAILTIKEGRPQAEIVSFG
jgi:putative phosphoesterase